jgi:hypothetical protein
MQIGGDVRGPPVYGETLSDASELPSPTGSAADG